MSTSSSSGSSGASGGTTGSAGGTGVAPTALPPRSVAIDLSLLSRGVAIQRYFERLVQDLLRPEYAPLLSSDPRTPADNVVLFGSKVSSWTNFRKLSSALPTVFLLPLVVGFSGPASNVLEPYAVTTPYAYWDNGGRFPMGVWVLARRPGGVDVFIYGGTIFPSAPMSITYHGIRDSELGAEWVVPPPTTGLDLDEFLVIVPADDVKVSLTS